MFFVISNGISALHLAQDYGHSSIVNALRAEGADVNQKNHAYVVEGLAEGGAVSHACCCRNDQAPIHKAARGGDLLMLEFLVARGADVNAQNE